MLSDPLSSRKPQFKSCCMHWMKLSAIPYPQSKDHFVWLNLQMGEVIREKIKKEQIQNEIRKYPTVFIPKQCNLFINRLTLLIYCVTCQKEIFDIYSKFSTSQELNFIKHQKLNPFKIRQHFLKPVNEENIFLSNLQNPKSFQKQKSNCAFLISSCRNRFLECVIRILTFIPTFSSIAQKVKIQKIQSSTFKQLIRLIKTLGIGKLRILNIDEFQDVFFSQYKEFLSYEARDPMKVLFLFFKLIQRQFGWKGSLCDPKQILETPPTEWDIQKTQYKYSPLKEMLLSKTQIFDYCQKCKKLNDTPLASNYFECMSIEVKLETINMPFMKRKANELNILKAIQSSFKGSKSQLGFCQTCSGNTDHAKKTLINPGNYILFHLEQSENTRMVVPKQFDISELPSERFVIHQQNIVFQFIGGIFKQLDEKQNYASEFGVLAYHLQNKKYISFTHNNLTQHESLNLEKPFSILLYKRKTNQSLFPLIKNIKSTLYLIEQGDLHIDNPIPLPDFYDIFLTQNSKIPPLINPFICHHGRINIANEQLSKCTKISYIPVEIYNFLVDQFGGRRVSEKFREQLKQECEICAQGLESLHKIKAIQREAMKYADNFAIKKGEVLIYKTWVQSWKAYLYQKSRQNYNVWGNPPPLQIKNFLGMKDKNLKLIDHSKYSKISNQVWMALVAFHSGGPQLTTKKIAKNNSVRNFINLKLQQAEPYYEKLFKCLSPTVKSLLEPNIRYHWASLIDSKQESHLVSPKSDDEDSDRFSVRSGTKSKSKPKLTLNFKDMKK